LAQHLSNDQIEELLRYALHRKPGAKPDPTVPDNAQLHLMICEGCQDEARAQESAMERLEILKLDAPLPPTKDCPPDDVWLQIAVGIELKDTGSALDHASRCKHCGPLLSQAMEDLAAEPTPEEELLIAGLASATTEWQQNLAARISKAASSSSTQSAGRKSLKSLVWALISPWPLAFSVSLAGLTILGIANYRLAANLSAERENAAREINRLELQLKASQRGSAVDMATRSGEAQSATAPEPTGSRHLGASEGSKPEVSSMPIQMASLVLDAGLTRGPREMKRISLPASTPFISVTLHLRDSPEGNLHIELLSADRRRIWTQIMDAANIVTKNRDLSFVLPSKLLPPNDYQFSVSEDSTSGIEEIGTYVFRVTR
jgi:hypothetical protein